MVTDFYLQFQKAFCRYIKYVARYIFIRSFLLYLHGFLHSDKTAPPHSRACNKRNIMLLLYGKAKLRCGSLFGKTSAEGIFNLILNLNGEALKARGSKARSAGTFGAILPESTANKPLRPQCSIRFRLRNRSKAGFAKKSSGFIQKGEYRL